jgi:TPR repeat protein
LGTRKNDADAQYKYAVCLENGVGVNIDLINAAKGYKLAADHNHEEAQNHYADCLQNGLGVETDLIDAAKYYKLAADHNLSGAQCNTTMAIVLRMDWVSQLIVVMR